MVRAFPRNLDALEGVFSFVEQALASVDTRQVDVRDIQLVVEELFTNCLRYNADGQRDVEIELRIAKQRLQVIVTDHGVKPFDITQVPVLDPARPLSERRGGGMGLQLVRSLCDDLRYEHTQGTSRIIAEKQLRSDDV